jgi:hypothetical protein
MSAKIIHLLMTLRDQIKLYHWQTTSHPRHTATNDLLPKLDANIDQFVEVYIGKYGRPKITDSTSTIQLRNFHEKQAPALLKEAIHWMTHDLPKQLKPSDTDLLNIRDTIVADLNQVLYLFTFN